MHNGGTAMLPEGLVTGRRILVVGHSFLGDALMTTPFIRALADSGPDALGILAAGHGLDVYGRLPFAPILHERSEPSVIRRIRQTGYDLAFVLKDDLSSVLAVWRCAIKERRGFARECSSLFLTRAVRPSNAPVHGAARHFALAGIPPPPDLKTEYHLRAEERARASVLLAEVGTPYIVLAPSTTRPEKNWPLEQCRDFIQRITQSGQTVVLLGAGTDRQRHSLMSKDSGALDLTGLTTTGEAAALIEGAACVVACDSGPMHLAAALGRPLVALFGQTDPARCGPCSTQAVILRATTACSPCLNHRCGSGARCMASIPAEKVCEACMHLTGL